jgi:hypothetical protein
MNERKKERKTERKNAKAFICNIPQHNKSQGTFQIDRAPNCRFMNTVAFDDVENEKVQGYIDTY